MLCAPKPYKMCLICLWLRFMTFYVIFVDLFTCKIKYLQKMFQCVFNMFNMLKHLFAAMFCNISAKFAKHLQKILRGNYM